MKRAVINKKHMVGNVGFILNYNNYYPNAS